MKRLYEFSDSRNDRFVIFFRNGTEYVVSTNVYNEHSYEMAKIYHFDDFNKAKEKFIEISKNISIKE